MRAYATNSVGTVYSEEVFFTTQVATNLNTLKDNKPIIYPNPTKGIIHLSNNLLHKKYSMYSVTGEIINTGFLNDQILNVSELKKGIYILLIGDLKFKIIKE